MIRVASGGIFFFFFFFFRLEGDYDYFVYKVAP